MRRLLSIVLGLGLSVASSLVLAQSPGPTITQDGLILQSNATATGAGTPINVGGFGIITYQVTALSGTATIVPESSIDGTHYNTLTCYALDGTTSVTSFSGTGTWRCNVTGQNWAQARISACTGCTVSVQATKWVSGQVSKAPTHIPVPVTEGGTGDTTLTSGAYLKGAGTSPVTSQAVPIPCTDGGTGLTSGTSGGVLAYTGSCTLASSGALTQHGVMIGGGAGAVPLSTGTGTTGQVLTSNGSGADPTYQAVPSPTIANGGTGTTVAGYANRGCLKGSVTNSTTITFTPFGGCNTIQIAGAVYTVPLAGFTCTALGVTNVLEYLYATQSGGVVACAVSTTGHVTDGTTGNIGIEVKSGDTTSTLIGMAFEDGSSHFNDSVTLRTFRNWFNDPGIAGLNNFTTARSTTSATYTELNTEIRIQFVIWANENVQVNIGGTMQDSATNGCFMTLAFDSTTSPEDAYSFTSTTATFPIGVAYAKSGLAEGQHYITVISKSISGDTCTARVEANSAGNRTAMSMMAHK